MINETESIMKRQLIQKPKLIVILSLWSNLMPTGVSQYQLQGYVLLLLPLFSMQFVLPLMICLASWIPWIRHGPGSWMQVPAKA